MIYKDCIIRTSSITSVDTDDDLSGMAMPKNVDKDITLYIKLILNRSDGKQSVGIVRRDKVKIFTSDLLKLEYISWGAYQ